MPPQVLSEVVATRKSDELLIEKLISKSSNTQCVHIFEHLMFKNVYTQNKLSSWSNSLLVCTDEDTKAL